MTEKSVELSTMLQGMRNKWH
jgi:hypothetical protein